MYEKAQGVNQDKTKAKELYKIACDDKIEFGCKAYKELK
jgi:TPR repeat protein